MVKSFLKVTLLTARCTHESKHCEGQVNSDTLSKPKKAARVALRHMTLSPSENAEAETKPCMSQRCSIVMGW